MTLKINHCQLGSPKSFNGWFYDFPIRLKMTKRTIAPTNFWYILKTLFSKSQPFTIWPKSLNTLQCNGWIIRFLHNYLKKILNPLVFNKLTRVAIYPQKTKTLNWILACMTIYYIWALEQILKFPDTRWLQCSLSCNDRLYGKITLQSGQIANWMQWW